MRLTIFTPTYNRSNLLKRLYDSLLQQDSFDFEWLVIDDDSSDDTEIMINKLIPTAPFEVHFYKQLHGGKHRAINKAISLAKGEYFFIVDSDDWLPPNIIKCIYKWIDSTKSIDYLAGISGLKVSNNIILGGIPNIKSDYIEASNFERLKFNLGGDKAEIYKTSILKLFPFPEFDNEYFVTEDVCWNAIAHAGYKIRWYNVPIYHCNYLEDGLTKSGANSISGHMKNYQGYCYYIKQLIEFRGIFSNPRLLNDYKITAKSLNKSCMDISNDLGISYLKSCLMRVCIYIGFIKSVFYKIIRKLGVK